MTRQRNFGLRKVCDCPRRTWAKCSHPWHFSFKWKGVHHRFSLNKHLGEDIDNKSDAETAAGRIRRSIKEGRFGQPAPREEMTLRTLAATYLERYVRVERSSTAQAFTWAMDTICRTSIPRPDGTAAKLGDWRVVDLVTDSIERFREARRAQTGPVGVNRNLGSLRAMFNWAIRVGYVDQSPFKRASEPVVKLSAEHSRSRRLDTDADEETRLLAACGPHLRTIVEAALETGMRRGEILSLQWSQVEGMKVDQPKCESTTHTSERRPERVPYVITWAPRAELVLPWAKTKTRRDRRIPISTRLKAILELRRIDPAGEPMADDRYAFGNEIGQRVQDIKRAWHTAVLKAHGHKPTYTATANLSAESQQVLEAIDLHFHDLRREAGSRWLEGGVPLHTVRDWLGHTSIAQTSTYLAGTMLTQHDAMTRFEERRGTLQPFATGSKTGGRKRPRTAGRTNRKPNKTGTDLGPTIM